MIRNDDYFEIIKEQNKELAKFRPFKSAYEMKKEIERLNNIINEFEKYIKTDAKIELYKDVSSFKTFVDGQDLLDKLQELKGSDKE